MSTGDLFKGLGAAILTENAAGLTESITGRPINVNGKVFGQQINRDSTFREYKPFGIAPQGGGLLSNVLGIHRDNQEMYLRNPGFGYNNGAQWGAPQQSGYGYGYNSGRGQGYGRANAQQMDPETIFVGKIAQAQMTQDPRLLEEAVRYGNSIARDGIVDLRGRHFRLPMNNGKTMDFDFDNQEARSPEDHVRNLTGSLAQRGLGSPMQVPNGYHAPQGATNNALPPSAQDQGQHAAPATASQTPAAPATGAATSTAPVAEPVTIVAAQGAHAKAVHEKFPALPAAQNQVMDIQKNLIAAGEEVGPVLGQADGISGRRTWTAYEKICVQAGIDPKKVDFTNPEDPETKQFNAAIADRIAKRNAPAAAAAPQGPSAEQLAADAARQRAQAQAEFDALPVFDPRKIERMDGNQRYALARETLLGIGELKHENKLHKLENMHDKMKEAVRDANKILGGDVFKEPAQDAPFTNDAMAALGVVATRKAEKQIAQGHANPALQDALARAHEAGALNSSISGGQAAGALPGDLVASNLRSSSPVPQNGR